MKSIVAIKRFFEQDGEKIDLTELKALSIEDREELGRLACVELGEEWEPAAKAA